jgi:hypothetical protein
MLREDIACILQYLLATLGLVHADAKYLTSAPWIDAYPRETAMKIDGFARAFPPAEDGTAADGTDMLPWSFARDDLRDLT